MVFRPLFLGVWVTGALSESILQYRTMGKQFTLLSINMYLGMGDEATSAKEHVALCAVVGGGGFLAVGAEQGAERGLDGRDGRGDVTTPRSIRRVALLRSIHCVTVPECLERLAECQRGWLGRVLVVVLFSPRLVGRDEGHL